MIGEIHFSKEVSRNAIERVCFYSGEITLHRSNGTYISFDLQRLQLDDQPETNVHEPVMEHQDLVEGYQNIIDGLLSTMDAESSKTTVEETLEHIKEVLDEEDFDEDRIVGAPTLHRVKGFQE